MEATEGLGAGLQQFLEWAGRTGEMNPKTADAWATACRQILALEDDPGSVDVRQLDVEDLLRRFQNLNRTNYSSGSMKTYQSRFRQAVSAYRAWLNNEPWKPTARAAAKARDASGGMKLSPESDALTVAAIAAPEHSTPRLVNYTVPLRPDLMVNISLPVDLTAADAERISAFVRSLAFTQDSPPTTGVAARAATHGA